VAFGPVFDTGSKVSAYGARGLEVLHEAVRLASPRPLIAIGGIDARNCAETMRAGAAGIAVISCIAGADDPAQSCRQLAAALASVYGEHE
jgi:thiamine monophosphate synthase